MGLEIKKKDDMYQMISSVTGNKIHSEKWVDEREAKKILAIRAFYHAGTDEMLKLIMDFPNGYQINGKRAAHTTTFLEWQIENLKQPDTYSEKYAKLLDDKLGEVGLHLSFLDLEDGFFVEQDAVDLLMEARLQIKYLSDKFCQTGTGNSVLAKLDRYLSKYEKDGK